MNRLKPGGKLLAIGAGVALLLKVYWIVLPNENTSIAYKLVGQIFGSWLAVLIAAPTTEGTALEFPWVYLIWIPWAAVVIAFLFWVAIQVIRGQFKSDLVPLPVLGILGVWFLGGFLYEKISSDFYYFDLGLKWLLPELLSDFATVAMIVGIVLILFNYNKAMTNAIDGIHSTGEMSLSEIFFSFEGRISLAQYWLYQVLILNLIFIFCIAIGAAAAEDGIIAGYAIGALLILWPSLALNVKRCHDRNRSGAFVWLSLIPLVNLWYAVEVLFLQGTVGDNQYGPDPLEDP